MNPGSSVNKVNVCEQDYRESISNTGRDFSLRQHFQAGSVTQPIV
jgi:hypothetical protein